MGMGVSMDTSKTLIQILQQILNRM